MYNRNEINNVYDNMLESSRLIIKGGYLVDPKNDFEGEKDISIKNGVIFQNEDNIIPEKGDIIINCDGLFVFPGLIDMHLHLGDLFEISTNSIYCAACDGVTCGFSPGAGNTFMAPALLGAEVDRGVPLNLGVYLGAANILGTRMTIDELIAMFRGEADEELLFEKMTRNTITNATASLVVGIKDHMGHFIMPDEDVDKIFEVTSKAGLLYMSHTQDPKHAIRMVELAKKRPLHLGHMTAAGCGTHGNAEESLKLVMELLNNDFVTGEFVTTMLRQRRGSKEGLVMTEQAQQIAYDALNSGKVNILVSDGQNQSTMKGFGDTRDNIPSILELYKMGILTLKESVATMTCNPVELLANRTHNEWWRKKIGHLGIGAVGNVTIVDLKNQFVVYTIVNGEIVAFENRIVRRGMGAGSWISKFGILKKTGVGEVPMYSYYE